MDGLGFVKAETVEAQITEVFGQVNAALSAAQTAFRTDIDLVREEVRALDRSVASIQREFHQARQAADNDRVFSQETTDRQPQTRVVADLQVGLEAIRSRLTKLESGAGFVSQVQEEQVQLDALAVDVALARDADSWNGPLVLERDQGATLVEVQAALRCLMRTCRMQGDRLEALERDLCEAQAHKSDGTMQQFRSELVGLLSRFDIDVGERAHGSESHRCSDPSQLMGMQPWPQRKIVEVSRRLNPDPTMDQERGERVGSCCKPVSPTGTEPNVSCDVQCSSTNG